MKKLLTLLILFPVISFGQDSLTTGQGTISEPCCPLVIDSSYVDIYSASEWKQNKPAWYKFTKNDAYVSSCFFMYGFIKGWADQIEFHHYEMSQQFPALFRNGNTFWDGRYDDDGICDAKHLAAGLQGMFMTAAVCIKVGDLRKYKKKDRFWKTCFDVVKYDFSRRLGFFISYNVINKNKLFK